VSGWLAPALAGRIGARARLVRITATEHYRLRGAR